MGVLACGLSLAVYVSFMEGFFIVYRGFITVEKILRRFAEIYGFIEGSYKMRTTPMLVTTWKWENEASEEMGVARTAMRTTPISATVGTVETRRKYEVVKVRTLTMMAALGRQKRRQLR